MKPHAAIAVAIVATLLLVACGGDSNEDGTPKFEAVYKTMTFPAAGPEIRVERVAYETRHRWRIDVLEDEGNPANEGAWHSYDHSTYTYALPGQEVRKQENQEMSLGEAWAPIVIAPHELSGEGWIRNGEVYENRTSYRLECPNFESLECRGGTDSVEQRELEVRNADGILLEYREYADDQLIRFTTISELAYD